MRIVLPIFFFSILALGFTGNVFAQGAQGEEIETRLAEVKSMIEEEQSTISLLEGQLKTALEDGETERVQQLRDEIDAAFENIEELQKLNDSLKELQDEAGPAAGGAQPRRPGRRRSVPNPTIGGSEGGVDWEAERKRRERQKSNRRRGTGDRGSPIIGGAPSGNVRAGGNRGNRARNGSSKLNHLRDAFDALLDAGETELAEDVQEKIDMEEQRLRDSERSRDREAAPSRGSGNRGAGNRGDGPLAADGPSRPRFSNRSGNRDRNQERNRTRQRDEGDDELDDLRDELNRLRERLEEQERRQKGNGSGSR